MVRVLKARIASVRRGTTRINSSWSLLNKRASLSVASQPLLDEGGLHGLHALVRCSFLKKCKAKECRESGYVLPVASSVEDVIAGLRSEEGEVAMSQCSSSSHH